MAIKTVEYVTSTFLDCAGIVMCGSAVATPVFLMLPDGLALDSASGAPRNTIPASLTKVSTLPAAGCGSSTYQYTFAYDDVLLVGNATLVTASIEGIKCVGAGTTLIDDKIHEEILTIVGEIRLLNNVPIDIANVTGLMIDLNDNAQGPPLNPSGPVAQSYLATNPNLYRSMSLLLHMHFSAAVVAVPPGVWNFSGLFRIGGGAWNSVTTEQYGPYAAASQMPWNIHWTRPETLAPGESKLIEIAAQVDTVTPGPGSVLNGFIFHTVIDGHLI